MRVEGEEVGCMAAAAAYLRFGRSEVEALTVIDKRRRCEACRFRVPDISIVDRLQGGKGREVREGEVRCCCRGCCCGCSLACCCLSIPADPR